MGKLSFNAKNLSALLDHSFSCTEHKITFTGDSGPGLLICGDSGVYCMSTGNPAIPDPERNSPNKVVCAEGCDPLKNADDWWDVKRRTWGGDDGVDFISFTKKTQTYLKNAIAWKSNLPKTECS